MTRLLAVALAAVGAFAAYEHQQLVEARRDNADIRDIASGNFDSWINCETKKHRFVQFCSDALDEVTRRIRERENQIDCSGVIP